jgi:DNA-binding response OmpR family regulator
MNKHHAERLARATKTVRANLFSLFESVDHLCSIVDEIAMGSDAQLKLTDSTRPSLTSATGTEMTIAVDRQTMTVRCEGRQCHLGFTLLFRVMEKLAARPNQYIRIEHLMAEVWGAVRSSAAVRSAISDLRAKLTAAGMAKLAHRIDGSNRGHYALLLDEI